MAPRRKQAPYTDEREYDYRWLFRNARAYGEQILETLRRSRNRKTKEAASTLRKALAKDIMDSDDRLLLEGSTVEEPQREAVLSLHGLSGATWSYKARLVDKALKEGNVRYAFDLLISTLGSLGIVFPAFGGLAEIIQLIKALFEKFLATEFEFIKIDLDYVR